MNIYEHHLRNIPIVVGETDASRYLRAFDRALAAEGDDGPDAERLEQLARSAIRFIADDAFRGGFESCHQNVVRPLKDGTITREAAQAAMATFGERVRQTIVAKFEEAPGVPNQITVDIYEVDLPKPKLPASP